MTELNDTLDDTLGVTREPPKPRSFSKAYWDATREKRLLVQYDKRSGRYQFFPRATSIYDGRRDLEWREVSGKGVVYSYTVTQRGTPSFRGAEPYAVVSVTLDVGVNFIADMVNCAAEDLKIGMKVKPYWHPLGDGTHLMLFQPDHEPT